MRTLKLGCEGSDVKRVQQFLVAGKFLTGIADGRYGPITAQAVNAYQSKHDLTADGVCGRLTLAAMMQEGLDVVLDIDQEWPSPPDWLVPLTSNEQRMRKFGRFEYRPAPEADNPEGIQILGNWEEENLSQIPCPVWERKITLHKLIVDDYLAFMGEIAASPALRALMLTFDGSFNARYIRGSRVTLSNHAWGTAFDINADFNTLGSTPAYRGELGSVREIVPLANQHNFYWGGHYRFRRDGMHFEHV
jgi:peptidoglycan hydrolase-like protein with peptidoglycan-binding domain